MTIDLHIHTTASDGSCSPADVVQLASKAGLKIIAITDHETTQGYFLAQNEALDRDLVLIPAVELLTGHKGREVHLLGYLRDPENRCLQENLAELRFLRTRSAEACVNILQEHGFKIFWADVLGLSGDAEVISKGHIVRALKEAGYIKSRADAVHVFSTYLNPEGLAYMAPELSFTDAVAMLKSCEVVPVLAHPALVRDDKIVEELCHLGIEGLEVYYCYFGDKREEWVKKYSLMAERQGLYKTGGSDFHGIYTPVILGETRVPIEEVSHFLKVFELV